MNDEQTSWFAGALNRLSGDVELLISMAEIVSEDAPEIVAELEAQLEAGAVDPIVSAAHKLKGMCSTFETGPPVSQLEDLLHAARREQVDEARAIYSRCAPNLQALLIRVKELSSAT
ncbi:Hpt domain protein [Rosistilla ulvae]|uniref:Hpt domain protein n=1 Tax=Rosistilla ulvae TaxID=1930277 RepID=A0A517M172_9BACT|nr:Hpt domain-containing protein [Rosistilla ulvae]QDS88630.1 Hpt domain protein [Rosistilla ulvae]